MESALVGRVQKEMALQICDIKRWCEGNTFGLERNIHTVK